MGFPWTVIRDGLDQFHIMVPIFDETFEFRIMLPELAFLRFVVLEDDHTGDCFIGQYKKPVEYVRKGKFDSSSLW